jgi:preprotein translocase subunit SecG
MKKLAIWVGVLFAAFLVILLATNSKKKKKADTQA